MSFSFLNVAILFGLAAVVIPPLIHLLNRRRYEVVDWGAMQFLQISEITRRRLLIEELLLMLLRMLLIAVLVMAVAGPFMRGVTWLPQVGKGNRDVVLILDGSASMTFERGDKTTDRRGREWVEEFLNKLQPGDTVALIQAREQVVAVVPTLTSDMDLVREKLKELPQPSGSVNWATAVQQAKEILKTSTRPRREIVILSDGQAHGWSDHTSLIRWEDLASQSDPKEKVKPNLYAVNLDPDRPANAKDQANWTLGALRSTRAVVAINQEVRFQTEILLQGNLSYRAPYEIRLEVDGKTVKKLEPARAEGTSSQVPLSFDYKFTRPGSHLVSVIMTPDLPKSKRLGNYDVRDRLKIDNRQDFAIEVIGALPVLIVDGDDSLDPEQRGSDDLLYALAPKKDPSPVVTAHRVSIDKFKAEDLTKDLPPDPRLKALNDQRKPGTMKPRVLILYDVKSLSKDLRTAIEEFLKQGGGVFVCLGGRADVKAYNALHREGLGWLPCRLNQIEGNENEIKNAAKPIPASFFHPALAMFRTMRFGGLDNVESTRWWKVTVPQHKESGKSIAKLNKLNSPWLVERAFGEGRVILSTLPFDTKWRCNLPNQVAFTPLCHELVYYLAGARSAQFNLQPGQPLRYRLPPEGDTEGLTLESPSGLIKPLKVDEALTDEHYVASLVQKGQYSVLTHEGMREVGVWKLRAPDSTVTYYAVQPDSSEANLSLFNDEDRKKVNELVPMEYLNKVEDVVKKMSSSDELELWWWFLLAIIGFLCMEVWLTRRIVKNRE